MCPFDGISLVLHLRVVFSLIHGKIEVLYRSSMWVIGVKNLNTN